MGKMIIPALVAFGLSSLLVYLVLRLSRYFSWYDKHDERKIHLGKIPRLGGIGFATASIVTVLIFAYIFPLGTTVVKFDFRFISMLLAMPLVLIFGVVDDFAFLRPRYKLLVQIIAGLLVTASRLTFHKITIPSLGIDFGFGWFRYPLTLLWVVGITNAVNLIDGMDGLAGGIALLSASAFALMYSSVGNQTATLLCITLVASVLGFLIFNWPIPKAKIFMGDGGSQFLGFMLAILPLMDDGKGFATIPLPFAGGVLLIPIVDTFAAIWRRIRERRRIDSPDKAHMHHKLLNLGLTPRTALALVYLLQIGITAFVVLAFYINGPLAEFFLLISYLIAITFFTSLHFLNRHALLKQTDTKKARVSKLIENK